MADDVVTVALTGDVMLGRGVDQILAHPGDGRLEEGYVEHARTYVELAERVNGPIPRRAEPAWPWGEALPVLDQATLRVINLETAVTTHEERAPGKRVHYRMAPANLPCLEAAHPDVCVLANNHVLDHGVRGLEETLEVLDGAGLRTAGAGRTWREAWRPAAVPLPGGGRVVVLGVAMADSGVPTSWAAGDRRPGVAVLGGSARKAAAEVVRHVDDHRRPGDLVVVSIHWGSNWGYDVDASQVDLAHALIGGGVDVVHGHSSHHPRPIEVHDGRLVLYGCGDLINDYEGIGGHERYRSELRVVYLASLERSSGALTRLRMVPLRARRMRLEAPDREARRWLSEELDGVSRPFGTRVQLDPEGGLVVAGTGGRSGRP